MPTGDDSAQRGVVATLAKGGRGIVRSPAGAVFVAGVIPGEEIEFRVLPERRGAALQGRLLRVLNPSPDRVPPPCPHYGRCGGCNLQHLSYPGQLSGKRQILASNLTRLGGFPDGLAIETISSPPWRSRTHAEFRWIDRQAGFYRRGSHELEPVEDCLLVPEVVARWLKEVSLPGRVGESGEVAVVTDGSQLAARLMLAERVIPCDSLPAVDFSIAPFRLRVRPGTFVQANRFLLESMHRLVREVVHPLAPQRVVDLFAGSGFFTLPLAEEAGQVMAVEAVAAHGEQLRENIEANALTNVSWRIQDALTTAPPPADLYLVDPPRGGLSPRLIRHLVAVSPRAILYFSCDSATLARDLRQFGPLGYRPGRVVMLDNFPQTDHLETFVLLEPS